MVPRKIYSVQHCRIPYRITLHMSPFITLQTPLTNWKKVSSGCPSTSPASTQHTQYTYTMQPTHKKAFF